MNLEESSYMHTEFKYQNRFQQQKIKKTLLALCAIMGFRQVYSILDDDSPSILSPTIATSGFKGFNTLLSDFPHNISAPSQHFKYQQHKEF